MCKVSYFLHKVHNFYYAALLYTMHEHTRIWPPCQRRETSAIQTMFLSNYFTLSVTLDAQPVLLDA